MLKRLNLHVFSRTQHTFILLAPYTCATCFGLYLGHHQVCQYKNLVKEHTIKSKGPIVYGHYFLKRQNVYCKIYKCKTQIIFKNVCIKTFMKFRPPYVVVTFLYDFVYFTCRGTVLFCEVFLFEFCLQTVGHDIV